MYNKSWLPIGIAEIANGVIRIKDISTNGDKKIILDITTPWGEIFTDEWMSIEPENNITIKTGSETNPNRNFKYILKLLDVNENKREAYMQVISYVEDSSIAQYINITSNVPTEAQPGDIINYDYIISNNSLNDVQIRWLFATNVDSLPIYWNEDALSPINYDNINCWYDDWMSGPCNVGQTIISGGFIHFTGNIILPNSGQVYTMLRTFVYVPNYWNTGKHEYVIPHLSGGHNDIITINPCTGIVCENICDNDNLWSQTCNPSSGICEPNKLIESNSIICAATHTYDLIIKPHSWYTPSQATDGLLENITNISGEIINIFSSVTDWQYLGIKVYQKDDKVIIRTYLKELQSVGSSSNVYTLIPQFAWAALILISIFYITIRYGWIIAVELIKLRDLFSNKDSLTNEELTGYNAESLKRRLENCVTEICIDTSLNEVQKAQCIVNCKISLTEDNKQYNADLFPNADQSALDELVGLINQCHQDYLDGIKTYEEYVICMHDAGIEKVDNNKDDILEKYHGDAPAGSEEKSSSMATTLLLGIGILGTAYIIGKTTGK